MDEPDWLPESLVLWLWPHLKKQGAGAVLTAGIHLLALLLVFYVVVDTRTPGSPEQSVNVSLTNSVGMSPQDTLQPKLIQPAQSMVELPQFTVTDTAALRAMPVVTASNATQGQSQYLLRLWRFTLQYMRFPRNSLLSGQGGVVLVHVVIDRGGMADLIEIDTSSGNPELDAAALDVIRRAQPLPLFPDNLASDYFSTVIRLGYGSGAQGAVQLR
jgi:TonB family protein